MPDRATINRELAELVDYSWKRCESRYHYEHGGWRISSSCARCGLTDYLPPNFSTWSGIRPVLEWLDRQITAFMCGYIAGMAVSLLIQRLRRF